jgi:hypothetical protein
MSRGGLPNTQLETLFSVVWVSVPTPFFVLAAIYTRVCLLYEKGFRLLFLSAIEFEVNLQTYTKTDNTVLREIWGPHGSEDVGPVGCNATWTGRNIPLHFSPEDGDSMFLHKFGVYLQVHIALLSTYC